MGKTEDRCPIRGCEEPATIRYWHGRKILAVCCPTHDRYTRRKHGFRIKRGAANA